VIYDYKCSKCEHEFQRVLKVADVHVPNDEPCPECGEIGGVQRHITTPSSMGLSYNQHSKANDAFQKHVLAPIFDKVPKHLRAEPKFHTKREW
jgi:putative FmdB family regulatory protein